MAGHGGKREGAGRKPKATEQALLESLSPLHPLFLKGLESGLKDKQGVGNKNVCRVLLR